jgi:hypothetical protein
MLKILAVLLAIGVFVYGWYRNDVFNRCAGKEQAVVVPLLRDQNANLYRAR